ncbi:response regulator [Stenotrophomonas rhizophila]|uniref:response regulator n=1 Tax=Stenotrophomonas rhizophila TaxID=216778 RepID=UPI00081C2F2C|nr:response regulator transcription factor [Stenotrophomonas rhizophila]AOA72409.1 hypothetical protein BAY15_1975 [Stenotrophomonas rhizophila]
MVAEGIAKILEDHCDSSEIVANGEELLQSLHKQTPDLVVADISMPGVSGIDAIKTAHTQGCSVPFIFLTMHDEPAMALCALRHGAAGYVVKNAAGDELLSAIRTIATGRSYISQSMVAQLALYPKPTEYALTPKQQRILQYIDLGLRPAQIAIELGVSIRTIESHKYAMMQEFGVSGTMALLIKAREEKLL